MGATIVTTSCATRSTSTSATAPMLRSLGSFLASPRTMQSTPAAQATITWTVVNHSIMRWRSCGGYLVCREVHEAPGFLSTEFDQTHQLAGGCDGRDGHTAPILPVRNVDALPVGQIDRLLVAQLEPLEEDRGRVGRRDQPGGDVEIFDGARILDPEWTDSRATERREVAADAECGPEVARQRADVRPRRADDPHVDIDRLGRAPETERLEFFDRD